MPDLGNGYKFDTGDGNSLAIVNSVNTDMVSMKILDYAFDSTFTRPRGNAFRAQRDNDT